MKDEIAKEKENIEDRYKEELNALEAQKQRETEWYNGVMQQLNTESEQLEANHKERMKELRGDLVEIWFKLILKTLIFDKR